MDNSKMEYGACDYCGFTGPVSRKYYKYDIGCDCHSPKHFEIVYYCRNCKPQEPVSTIIELDGNKYFVKTDILKRITEEAKTKGIEENNKSWFINRLNEEVAAGTVLCLTQKDGVDY